MSKTSSYHHIIIDDEQSNVFTLRRGRIGNGDISILFLVTAVRTVISRIIRNVLPSYFPEIYTFLVLCFLYAQ